MAALILWALRFDHSKWWGSHFILLKSLVHGVEIIGQISTLSGGVFCFQKPLLKAHWLAYWPALSEMLTKGLGPAWNLTSYITRFGANLFCARGNTYNVLPFCVRDLPNVVEKSMSISPRNKFGLAYCLMRRTMLKLGAEPQWLVERILVML